MQQIPLLSNGYFTNKSVAPPPRTQWHCLSTENVPSANDLHNLSLSRPGDASLLDHARHQQIQPDYNPAQAIYEIQQVI